MRTCPFPLYASEELTEHQWLMKLNGLYAFYTKKTQKGALPKAFDEWGSQREWKNSQYVIGQKLPVYLATEQYEKGWAFAGARIGKSQNWAVMRHPKGYLLEIYLNDFEKLVLKDTMINGELQGEYLWSDNKLLRK